MAVWKLHHKEPYEQRPYLFFAAFCDQQAIDNLDESLPIAPGLEIAAMQASHFRFGTSWERAQREQPELAQAIDQAPLAVTLHGSVIAHESLDYLRDAIELMTALTEQGACGIYDPLTLTWRSADAWQEMAALGSIFNPFDHVALLESSEEGATVWLHTRGLRKFGRPDLCVRNVAGDEVEAVKKMLDRFINHLALGGIIEPERDVEMEGLPAVYRPGAPAGSVESPEFHNLHIEFSKAG